MCASRAASRASAIVGAGPASPDGRVGGRSARDPWSRKESNATAATTTTAIATTHPVVMADLPHRAVGDMVRDWTRLRLGLDRKRRDLDGAAPAGIVGIGRFVEA